MVIKAIQSSDIKANEESMNMV